MALSVLESTRKRLEQMQLKAAEGSSHTTTTTTATAEPPPPATHVESDDTTWSRNQSLPAVLPTDTSLTPAKPIKEVAIDTPAVKPAANTASFSSSSSPPQTTSLIGFVWNFFTGPAGAGQPTTSSENQDKDIDNATNASDSAQRAEKLIPLQAGRRSSILDSAWSFIESFVDPSPEEAPHGEHAAENLAEPGGWPTSYASLPPDEPLSDGPAALASSSFGSSSAAAAAVAPSAAASPPAPSQQLSPEEEAALRLEEEMNAVVQQMDESDLATWEQMEKEREKAKERESADYYKQKFKPPPKKVVVGAAALPEAAPAIHEDVDPEQAKKDLTQLLLDTLPPLHLVGRTDDVHPVISPSLAEELRQHLPHISKEARKWTLVYSLEQNGISLSTLYRLSADYEGAVVLGIRNTLGEIFGAFLSETLISKGGYYGTGECFLWKAEGTKPPWGVQVYRATGKDEFMIHTESSFLSFGGGDGVFGLWLDSELYHGHSEPSRSFANETLCSNRDFLIVGVELWGFAQ